MSERDYGNFTGQELCAETIAATLMGGAEGDECLKAIQDEYRRREASISDPDDFLRFIEHPGDAHPEIERKIKAAHRVIREWDGKALPLAALTEPEDRYLAQNENVLRVLLLSDAMMLAEYKSAGRGVQSTIKSIRLILKRLREIQYEKRSESRLKVTEEGFAERSGFIYFVRCGSFIKIGFAVDVERRLATIATASPEPITLLHSCVGTLKDEQAMHRRFAGLRHNREWFRAEGELTAFLQEAGCNV